MGKKRKKIVYRHSKKGDLIKVEIRDEGYNLIYRNKFNIKDKNAIYYHLKILEQYSGLSIPQLIKEKLKIGEWW